MKLKLKHVNRTAIRNDSIYVIVMNVTYQMLWPMNHA